MKTFPADRNLRVEYTVRIGILQRRRHQTKLGNVTLNDDMFFGGRNGSTIEVRGRRVIKTEAGA
ncbi:uncharacterized protein BJ212DRAFT_1359721 [Suillus subaureus]|uniref:Uncharacterized protein n=1 Tax=Suillus subaureus TaxID=48587 RepID=A0A9P7E9C2_9AGAM|nr:uncharacterized protein BJ212DRAFT_1359721 [Suillus subaureus]KAG1815137.1 hypothetical protein BJ212DRAFT_1359721 [Suillus subaureus]